jgi:hypothetical protein
VLGNATINPAVMPLPAISRVPCRDTWWGFVPQWLTGTQRTLMIRTVLTRALEVGLPVPPVLWVGVVPAAPPGALAPPGLAVAATAGAPPRTADARTADMRTFAARAPRAGARSGEAVVAGMGLNRWGEPALVIQLHRSRRERGYRQ